jgi:uncharacterized protein with ParB-like and HNH nuclease domain
MSDDFAEYTKNNNERGNESKYFLGSIVSFVNCDNEQEIIDGQQRITSLFLLLRAIYTKLESMSETKEVINFKNQIESCLWEQEELTAEVDFNKSLITSKCSTPQKVYNEKNQVTPKSIQKRKQDTRKVDKILKFKYNRVSHRGKRRSLLCQTEEEHVREREEKGRRA